MIVWRKALESNSTGQCVEVGITNDGVKVRDSKHGEASPVLSYTFTEWAVFLRAVKGGEFDLEPCFDPDPSEEWITSVEV
ncbi:DUF397 domain-containing protein [Planotetraspora phitsanulokensis]|uniref:DUF397 domain-containing protein n=1 Tax=Planotetraspora phitsanulokensis TaxID=575192 RepID=UPI001EF29509|nr:DUF397 domain-containing protein [Planotetraspora phitsanulokensis]